MGYGTGYFRQLASQRFAGEAGEKARREARQAAKEAALRQFGLGVAQAGIGTGLGLLGNYAQEFFPTATGTRAHTAALTEAAGVSTEGERLRQAGVRRKTQMELEAAQRAALEDLIATGGMEPMETAQPATRSPRPPDVRLPGPGGEGRPGFRPATLFPPPALPPGWMPYTPGQGSEPTPRPGITVPSTAVPPPTPQPPTERRVTYPGSPAITVPGLGGPASWTPGEGDLRSARAHVEAQKAAAARKAALEGVGATAKLAPYVAATRADVRLGRGRGYSGPTLTLDPETLAMRPAVGWEALRPAERPAMPTGGGRGGASRRGQRPTASDYVTQIGPATLRQAAAMAEDPAAMTAVERIIAGKATADDWRVYAAMIQPNVSRAVVPKGAPEMGMRSEADLALEQERVRGQLAVLDRRAATRVLTPEEEAQRTRLKTKEADLGLEADYYREQLIRGRPRDTIVYGRPTPYGPPETVTRTPGTTGEPIPPPPRMSPDVRPLTAAEKQLPTSELVRQRPDIFAGVPRDRAAMEEAAKRAGWTGP